MVGFRIRPGSIKHPAWVSAELEKYPIMDLEDYDRIRPSGRPGKEGVVSIAVTKGTRYYVAIKQFRDKKSQRLLAREIAYQSLAHAAKVAPAILGYNLEQRIIVMERLQYTLLDVLAMQSQTLLPEQQQKILSLFDRLDQAGIVHGDTNPLNLMNKGARWYLIDYGFTQFSSHRDYKKHPNPNRTLMPLGVLKWLRELQIPSAHLRILRDAVPLDIAARFSMASWP